MTDADLLAQLGETARRVANDGTSGWERWAELGWLALLVAEEHGGAGADENAAAIVARELGRAGRREPFVAAGVLPTVCLAALPTSPPVTRLLEEVMAAQRRVALAWQPEIGPCLDLNRLGVTAKESEGSLLLDGVACWVPSVQANTYLILARADNEVLLLRVGHRTAGLDVRTHPAADGGAWERLHFSASALLPADAVVARGATALRAVRRGIDVAALIASAELLGGIDRMVNLTVDYLATRRQFGRPIGTFQVLQHRAVDMWMQQRLADAALDGALRRTCRPDASDDDRALAASSAKARASQAASLIANEAVQLHGAVGFTAEYELGRHVNRSLVLSSWLGNAAEHTRRFGRLTAA